MPEGAAASLSLPTCDTWLRTPPVGLVKSRVPESQGSECKQGHQEGWSPLSRALQQASLRQDLAFPLSKLCTREPPASKGP